MNYYEIKVGQVRVLSSWLPLPWFPFSFFVSSFSTLHLLDARVGSNYRGCGGGTGVNMVSPPFGSQCYTASPKCVSGLLAASTGSIIHPLIPLSIVIPLSLSLSHSLSLSLLLCLRVLGFWILGLMGSSGSHPRKRPPLSLFIFFFFGLFVSMHITLTWLPNLA